VRKFSDTVRREDARITHHADARVALRSEPGDVDQIAGVTTREANADQARETSAPPQEPDATIELREEELQIRTQVVEADTVQVQTGVIAEQQSMVVRVEHEEVAVEQVLVEPRPADRPLGSGDDVLDIPVYGEQVTLLKNPVVTEEIRVRKEVLEEVQRVTATVRREVAHVESEGNVTFTSMERQSDRDDRR
jgi:uncharacterized protein (TIGR02271 family)